MILVLGDGLLATEVVAQTGWPSISRNEHGFDLDNPSTWSNTIPSGVKTIVNCIANTDTYSDNAEAMFMTNYQGPMALTQYCNQHNIKLVHYSTDYVYAGSIKPSAETDFEVPADNWYAKSKLMADKWIAANCNNYLICRGSHKLNPFPWENAWNDQIGNFDYVDKIVTLFVELIRRNASGIYNIGTESKTIYEMALQTNSSVQPISAPFYVPKNLSMDLTKMKSFLGIKYNSLDEEINEYLRNIENR